LAAQTQHRPFARAQRVGDLGNGIGLQLVSRIGQRAHVRFQDEHALQAAAFGLGNELQVRQQR